MKKVYIANLNSGFGGPVKVFASGEDEAKLAAYSAYSYNTDTWFSMPTPDDVVKSVEIDPEQKMGGVGTQPVVQTDCKALTAREVLAGQFSGSRGNS